MRGLCWRSCTYGGVDRPVRRNRHLGPARRDRLIQGSGLAGSGELLREHPAMALEVLDAIRPRAVALLRLGQHIRAGAARLLEVRIQVLDPDVHAVDHVRARVPGGAALPLTLVERIHVTGWAAEHHHAVAEPELHVRDAPVVLGQAELLAESEGTAKPV